MQAMITQQRNHKHLFLVIISSLLLVMMGLSACAKPVSAPTPTPNSNNLPLYWNPKHPLPTPGCSNRDKDGIRLHDYKGEIGKQYNPLFIAIDARSYYSDYTNIPEGFAANPLYKEWFFKTANWLYEYADKLDNDLLFPYKFAHHGVEPPWYSAISQARVALVFTYAYSLSQDEKWIKAAKASIEPIFRPLSEDGFLYVEKDLMFFEEYPKPSPNHVLNAHMSVIKDLSEVNKELKDDRISFFIDKGIDTLLEVLKLYEAPHLCTFFYFLPPGESIYDWGEKLKALDSTYTTRSYDFIHLRYLGDLATIRHNRLFRKYFWKYLAYMELRRVFFEKTNVISPKNGATIEEPSPFKKIEGHTFGDMANNFYKDSRIYTGTRPSDEPISFTINLNGEKVIDEFFVQFHWSDYPAYFKLENYYGEEWQLVFVEEGRHPSEAKPTYSRKFMHPFKAEKIRFTADQFSDQKRLILDCLVVKQAYSKELHSDILASLEPTGIFQATDPKKLASEYLKPVEQGTLCSLSEDIWLRNLRLNEQIASLASEYFVEPGSPKMRGAITGGNIDFDELADYGPDKPKSKGID